MIVSDRWTSDLPSRILPENKKGTALRPSLPLFLPSSPYAIPWYAFNTAHSGAVSSKFRFVFVLYCTDFETDPAEEGWTHELVSGTAGEGADDWQWGVPNGQNGDPRDAYSGDNVYGNDLGPEGWNGQYQNGKLNRTTLPPVDTGGFEVVRLQYRRWLNVEDGTADHARITAGGSEVWSNLADAGATHHLDAEWRSLEDADAFFASRDFQLFRGIRMLLWGDPFVVVDDVRSRTTGVVK